MNYRTLRRALSKLPLGGLKNYQRVSSTNDVALAWAADDAVDFSLVFAEEQSEGRGRGEHRWFTTAGTALAFSLILKPRPEEEASIPLFSGLAAVAVCEALEGHGLSPQIKWPNDILLTGRKVCGVLVESVWMGERAESLVLGMGVNVKVESVPPLELLSLPATSIETETGKRIHRGQLLAEICHAIFHWRGHMNTSQFLQEWEKRLAYQGMKVEVIAERKTLHEGRVEGLAPDGSLRLLAEDGQVFLVHFGEVNLRPVL